MNSIINGDVILFATFTVFGFLLSVFFDFNFKRRNFFKVARIHELPSGKYSVLDRKPKGRWLEVLFVQICVGNTERGPLIAVCIDHSLFFLLKGEKNKGNITNFFLSHKKGYCFITIAFDKTKESVTFQKVADQNICGHLWEAP